MIQSWTAHVGGLGPGIVGNALANSTTETDISPGGGSPAGQQITIPANMIDSIGMKLRLVAYGVFSTTGTPTLKLSFYPNAFAGGNVLGGTGLITTPSGVTNAMWRMEWEGVIRSIGPTGTIIGSGFCQISGAPGAAVGSAAAALNATYPVPNIAMAATTFNTTVSNTVTCAALWGTASASNTIQCHDLTVMSLC
jgi:hypothetical protein